MKLKKNSHKNLVEDVKKTLTDPIYNVTHNFSVEKSREYYDGWAKEFCDGLVKGNPAIEEEFEVFEYNTLEELQDVIVEAKWLLKALYEMPHVDEEWYMVGDNEVVVMWSRLKTFDEWLNQWLKDALCNAIRDPYEKARDLLCEKLNIPFLTRSAVDAFVEEEVNEEQLQAIFQEWDGRYEKVDVCDDCFIKMLEETKKVLKLNKE